MVLVNLNESPIGGGMGIRTPDLLIANETLYQLSYTPQTASEKYGGRAKFIKGEGLRGELAANAAGWPRQQADHAQAAGANCSKARCSCSKFTGLTRCARNPACAVMARSSTIP